MSIMQDFEEAKRIIGEEKYNAIDVYLNEQCPKEKMEKYEEELKKIKDVKGIEWIEQKEKMKKEYGIIFLDDVLYKQENWKNFEKWYENYTSQKVEIKIKNILEIKRVGKDDFERPIYIDRNGNYYKDLDFGEGTNLKKSLATVTRVYGEPIAYISDNIEPKVVKEFSKEYKERATR